MMLKSSRKLLQREAYSDALKINPRDSYALRGVSEISSLERKEQLARTLWRVKELKHK